MSQQRPRTGIFAALNGVEYEADSYPVDGRVALFSRAAENPDPTRFAWSAELGAWLAAVPVSECDRVVEVITCCDHAGLPCQIVSIAPNGATGLYYLGEETAVAAERGFQQVDPGTWAKTVHIFEILRTRELHTDLLFETWKAAR